MQAQGVRESTLFVTDRVWGARLVKEKGKVGEAWRGHILVLTDTSRK